MKRLAAAFALLVLTVAGTPTVADQGARPILTIEGAVEPARIAYTLDAFEGLGTRTITTTTPWDKGVVQYTGVALSRLLEVVHAKGSTLTILALNDFAAEVPAADAPAYEPILATRRNGEPLTVADKGPVFLVYPFADRPELQTNEIYARSVWQIKTIRVH